MARKQHSKIGLDLYHSVYYFCTIGYGTFKKGQILSHRGQYYDEENLEPIAMQRACNYTNYLLVNTRVSHFNIIFE